MSQQDKLGTRFQSENGHFRSKVGACPFCRKDSAQLWWEPDDWKPFQVRCTSCGACGPWADCGEGSAVPAWKSVEPKPRTNTPTQNQGTDASAGMGGDHG